MAGYRKLGLPTDQRKAMLRGLVTSFLKYGKIETTETRAKETRISGYYSKKFGFITSAHQRYSRFITS